MPTPASPSIWFGCAAAALVVGAPALAQDAAAPAPPAPSERPVSLDGDSAAPSGPPGADDRFALTLGVGGGIAPRYEGADEYRFQPGGLLQAKVAGVSIEARGPNLFIDVAATDLGGGWALSGGPVAEVRTDRSDPDAIEDPAVRALGKIDTAVELGGFAGVSKRRVFHPYDRLSIDVTVTHDVAGSHDSLLIAPSLQYTSPLSRRTLAILTLSAEHAGRGYGQTYFGVDTAGSAVSGLAPYSVTRAGWKSANATLILIEALGKRPGKGWSVFTLGSYGRIFGRYAASPIVAERGSADQFFAVGGFAYSF